LKDILPEAFAVVKETSRRLTENEELEVTANDFDRELAVYKSNVIINGDKAIWKNKWMAAGTEVTWNMVHYDVQLIGGIVLHSGKIAEMATGEGKTLVGTLPTYLNALSGQGVHIVNALFLGKPLYALNNAKPPPSTSESPAASAFLASFKTVLMYAFCTCTKRSIRGFNW